MPYQITIKQKAKKGLFKKTTQLNLQKLLADCSLGFGIYNEGYVLQEGETKNDTLILYNPKKIGRGIYLNTQNMVASAEITISYNIPTTPTEIKDFFKIISNIKQQYGEIEIFVDGKLENEETIMKLKDDMISFSFTELKTFFSKHAEMRCIQTLAKFPYTFSNEQREHFLKAENADEYEQLIHDVQNRDIYYAKPRLVSDNETNAIFAFYALTDQTESIFPIDGTTVLLSTLNETPTINEVFIRFVLYSEQRAIEGKYNYEKFIKYISKHPDITSYDDAHIIIPPLSKEEIFELIESIS